MSTNKCCEGRIETPYCPQCGTNLKNRSLLGLVEDLERRIDRAGETRKLHAKLTASTDKAVGKKALQGLARAEETIQRLACWLDLLKAQMAA